MGPGIEAQSSSCLQMIYQLQWEGEESKEIEEISRSTREFPVSPTYDMIGREEPDDLRRKGESTELEGGKESEREGEPHLSINYPVWVIRLGDTVCIVFLYGVHSYSS